jgi:DNA-binding MarR family transcriptional regulator
MDSVTTVIETLANSPEPLKAGEIADIAGIDKKDVEKAIKQLVQQGRVESPKRCYYGIINKP